MQLTQAKLQWHSDGTPISDTFDDIYFSSGEGAQETQYVFMDGNHLPERWHSCTRAAFAIGETGFGTGLNFLVAWHAFRLFRQHSPQHHLRQLRFVSVEKFPITREDLLVAHQALPEFALLSEQLIEQYPDAEKGCHLLEFDEQSVVLELWFGDVDEMLPQRLIEVEGQYKPVIDAWFLDGFAPSKNPEMWTQNLFNNLAKQSIPETSIATFTAAGFVRRGLVDAGFEIKKRKGFGRKREMLTGHFA